MCIKDGQGFQGMIDNDSKQEILREISAIRALLTRLQPDGGQSANTGKLNAAANEGIIEPDKRVMILF
jgi:hypothetical protein